MSTLETMFYLGGIWLAIIVTIEAFFIIWMKLRIDLVADRTAFLQYLEMFDPKHVEDAQKWIVQIVKESIQGIVTSFADPEKGLIMPIINEVKEIAQSVAGVTKKAENVMNPKHAVSFALADGIRGIFPGAGGNIAAGAVGGRPQRRCSRCKNQWPENPEAGIGHSKRSQTCPARALGQTAVTAGG